MINEDPCYLIASTSFAFNVTKLWLNCLADYHVTIKLYQTACIKVLGRNDKVVPEM